MIVNMLKTAAVTSLLMLLSGCVGLQQYRPQTSSHEKVDQKYDLFYVEFDDQGWPYDSNQLTKTIKFLDRQDPCKPGPLIIVFAHGWNHNASQKDSNVDAMKIALGKIKDYQKAAGKQAGQRPIVGVYVSWRGKSASIPPFHQMTFYDRKNTAHRVGQAGASDVFFKLEAAKQRLSDKSNQCAHTTLAPKLVIVGHSFGAALVYSAMGQALNQRLEHLAHISTHKDAKNYISKYTNQIFLFNPAFEAARVEHLMNMPSPCDSCTPLLSIITAKNDSATKHWFKLGRVTSNLLKPFTHRNTPVNQYSANITAIGHFDPWITHDGSAEFGDGNSKFNTKNSAEPLCSKAEASAHASKISSSRNIEFCSYKLTYRKSNKSNNQRIINISVDNTIARSHGLNENLGPFTKFVWDYIAVALTQESISTEK